MTGEMYHYTESGLDNVFLVDGYDFVETPQGRVVRIKDIDGLNEAIGRLLICDKKNLTGKEIRFLRQEMLMSQAVLAKLLDVGDQTVLRWEKGKAEIPKPAEALIRFLYGEHIKDKGVAGIRRCLEHLADLEDQLSQTRISLRQSKRGWKSAVLAAA